MNKRVTYISVYRVVKTWYDRRTRNWITQLCDENGNQIGDAMFAPDRAWAMSDHRDVVKAHK